MAESSNLNGQNMNSVTSDLTPQSSTNPSKNTAMSTSSMSQMDHRSSHQGHDEIDIRMRCPSCYKLYSLDPKTVYVEKPEFSCVACDQKFWISFPEALEQKEIVAFPIEWSADFKSELQTDSFIDSIDMQNGSVSNSLTHFTSNNAVEDVDPPQKSFQDSVQDSLSPALVEKITKNFSESLKDTVPDKALGLRKVGFVDDVASELTSEYWFLEKSWDKVLNNYDVKSIHKEFIHSARAKQSLDFALGKYKNFCEANHHDEMAKEMKSYCEKLIQDFAIHKSVLGNEPKGLKKYYKYLPWAVISVSAGLIGLGFSNEGLSDLAGFGFALIFLTGALSLLKESDL